VEGEISAVNGDARKCVDVSISRIGGSWCDCSGLMALTGIIHIAPHQPSTITEKEQVWGISRATWCLESEGCWLLDAGGGGLQIDIFSLSRWKSEGGQGKREEGGEFEGRQKFNSGKDT
jgi:hypothetical protein